MNYFEFYGIPVSFLVDEPALRQIYRQNSKKFHPDYHTLSNERLQAEMLELATQNNEAYQTLSDPELRMHYVLHQKGLLENEGKLSVPQDFLMEVMDINETLMELEFDYDETRYVTAAKLIAELEKTLNEGILPVLESYDDSPKSEESLPAVLEYFLKKRYLLRIQENLSKFAPR